MSVHHEPVVDESAEPVTRTSAAHTVRLVLGLILVVVVVALMTDNRSNTRVGYVFGDAHAPLFVVLVAAAVVGAGIGWLLLHRARTRS